MVGSKPIWEQFSLDLSLLLSSQRNVEDLNQALAKILAETFGSSPYRFYLNMGNLGAPQFQLFATNTEHPEADDEIHQISKAEFHLPVENELGQSLFPALIEDKILACVVTEKPLVNEWPAQLFCLLAVYSNVYQLISDSKQDGLTGLANRKTFDVELLKEISELENQRREQDDKNSFLALIDIDHFKQVNDKFGHLIGDEVLLSLSQLLKRCFREYDGVYRYGGEEFAIILRGIK
jgi:predicted signal transduction protein with EAL and GGDEF domain